MHKSVEVDSLLQMQNMMYRHRKMTCISEDRWLRRTHISRCRFHLSQMNQIKLSSRNKTINKAISLTLLFITKDHKILITKRILSQILRVSSKRSSQLRLKNTKSRWFRAQIIPYRHQANHHSNRIGYLTVR